ncbi:hypothetical protein SLA2020_423810 [Shorea laevis]
MASKGPSLIRFWTRRQSSIERVRFGAVCKSWGTAVKERRRLKTQVTQILMLLIPSKDNNKKARSLYSITDFLLFCNC